MSALRQLERYTDNLPSKPYCTDSFDFGLLIRSKNIAVKHRHIQHNKHTSVAYIVLDIDHPFSLQMLEEQLLPTPNFLVINPENYHAHVFYELSTPVYTTNFAREKPLRYLASIEYALRDAWNADRGYSSLISKNPFHKSWKLVQLRQEAWELGELADWLTLPSKLPRKAQSVGLGRNCTLFDMLRFWAYDNVINFRITGGGYNQWFKAVLSAANGFNTFPDPLGINEVTNTAKSVSKWVWTNYTKRLSDEEFSARQAERGRRGGKASGVTRAKTNEEKRVQARLLAAQGMSKAAIARELSVHRNSITNWLN